jgi:beta-glucuronidase
LEKSLFRLLYYCFFLALFPISLFSQQLFYENGSPSHPGVLGYESPTRTIIDLAGQWQYSLDNGTSWKNVSLPAAADYEGKIVYRRKFVVGADTVGRSTFTFVSYGINYKADVYVNETFIGKHEGGYTSFSFSIPEDVVQVGVENVIRVVVDNTLNYRTTFPVRQQITGMKNYNGIVRDVFIVASPKIWIEHADVSIESIEPKSVKLSVQAGLAAKQFLSDIQFKDKQFQISAEAIENSTGIVVGKSIPVPVSPEEMKNSSVQSSVAIANAKLWSPESPELYTVKIQIQTVDGKNSSVIDETSVTTGIRTITKDKNSILFNAAPVNLKGVVWIEDTEKAGSAVPYEKMERDVALIKNLGANAVRIGFHPAHPFFIQLCDRYGLLVLEEIPNIEIPSKILNDENYRSLAGEYLSSMITRDKHHPSVIAWGLGSGSSTDGEIDNSVQLQLHRTAKSLDGRLTYSVFNVDNAGVSTVTDLAAIDLGSHDVKTFRSLLQSWKDFHPNQPVFVGGYRKLAEEDNRNGYSDPMSQEAQARALLQRYTIIKELSPSGGFISTFNDYRSDRPVLVVNPSSMNIHTSGIVELNREKKVAYDVVRSMYLGEKISALPVGSYVAPSPYAYVVIGLALLVIVAWLINSNRRYRESTRRAIFNSYNFFADIRDQFTLPLFHTTVTAAIIAATFSVVLSSLLYYFRMSVVLDYVLSYFFPDAVKKMIITMAWDPVVCIAVFTGMMFLWFFVLTILIQLFSLSAKVKIRFFHSYSVAVWTALPWAFFIPVAMILFRVLQSEPYIPWIVMLILLMSLWVFLRTLKGISVIYHVYVPKMYIAGFVLLFAVIGGLYVYWNYTQSLSAYSEFFVTSFLPSVH